MDDDDAATFPAVLTKAIADRRMTLQGLSDRLARRGIKLSVATLSYWRSGRRHPERTASLEALDALEEILALPTGHLRRGLGPSKRPGPPRRELTYEELVGPQVAALVRQLGFPDGAQATELSSHSIMDVRADGTLEKITWRGVWQADVDGVDRVPQAVTAQSGGDDPGRAVVTPVSGCRVGRMVSDAGECAHAYELIFDRPLKRGETTIIEYVMSGLGEVRDTDFHLSIKRRMNELVIWVRFHPDSRAHSCESYTRMDGKEVVAALDQPGHTAHLVLHGFGPGIAGIRWSLDPA